MTKRQVKILQHTLGADEYGRRKQFSGRNHFCAGPADEPDCRTLVDLGYMKQHMTTEGLPYFNCTATEKGINAMLKESDPPPKLTRSQLRYRRWLDADCGMKFGEWIKRELEWQ